MRKVLVVTFAVASLALSLGCSSDKPQPTVQTAAGPMKVEKAQLSDRFPPGCEAKKPGCQQTRDGKPLLIVWLKGEDPESKLMKSFSEVFVEGANGKRSGAISGGMYEKKHFLMFALESEDKQVKLLFPGAEPVAVTTGK